MKESEAHLNALVQTWFGREDLSTRLADVALRCGDYRHGRRAEPSLTNTLETFQQARRWADHTMLHLLKFRFGERLVRGGGKVGHVTGNNFAQGLSREIWRHLGIKFNSHLARALVATIILDADPNGGPIAQRMLGHQHLETTIRHYGMQRGRAAQRQYEQFLARTLRGRAS